MSRLLLIGLTGVAVVVLPQTLLADDPAPASPRPEMLFKRLDANADGQITPDEIPDQAPESLKAMLKGADKNQDEKLTAEEFSAAVKQPPSGPMAGSRRPGPPSVESGRPGPPTAGSRRPGPPRPLGAPPWGPMHRLPGMRGGDGPPPFALGGPRPPFPDPKALFDRLDRDKDGKLSPEEFATGMRLLHPPGRPPFAGAARPPMAGHVPGAPRPFMPGRLPGAPRPLMPGRLPGAAGPPMGRPFGLMAADVFQKVDANRDGKVSLDEVPSDRRERFQRFLAMADKDGDKAISAEEARRAGAAISARARAAMAGRAAVAARASAARKVDTARRAAVVKRAIEARKRAPVAEKAVPSEKKGPKAKMTPEARKKAAEARKKKAEERKKAAEAKRRATKAKPEK